MQDSKIFKNLFALCDFWKEYYFAYNNFFERAKEDYYKKDVIKTHETNDIIIHEPASFEDYLEMVQFGEIEDEIGFDHFQEYYENRLCIMREKALKEFRENLVLLSKEKLDIYIDQVSKIIKRAIKFLDKNPKPTIFDTFFYEIENLKGEDKAFIELKHSKIRLKEKGCGYSKTDLIRLFYTLYHLGVFESVTQEIFLEKIAGVFDLGNLDCKNPNPFLYKNSSEETYLKIFNELLRIAKDKKDNC